MPPMPVDPLSSIVQPAHQGGPLAPASTFGSTQGLAFHSESSCREVAFVTHTRTFIKVTSAAALTAVVAVAGAALAPASASDDFGEHVVACAQGVGLDGSHNPGMHQGYAGWDPSHAC